VVLFHLRNTPLPGGYLGVDVFFVISGYVIMGSIARELQTTGRFRLKNFYVRRFNRLYPALLGVVSLTLIFSNYVIPLYDGLKVLDTGLLSAIGLANNYLFLSSQNYFNLVTKLNPFLHTWSLGIEEQFYVGFSTLIGLFVCFFNRKTRNKNIIA